jgi:arsenate reductase (thioredoxin)
VKTYLFACIHNAGRSQMAAAWFNRLAAPDEAQAISAGTEPGPRVHPEVLEAMKEASIDLSSATPRKLTDDLARGASMLVTMGCGEACPVIPGLRREDWPLEDPRGKPIERVRQIRDEVRGRIEDLIRREGVGMAAAVGASMKVARDDIRFRPSLPADGLSIRELLARARLPAEDLAAGKQEFVVAVLGRRLVGCIGLETHDGAGLLRSFAVDGSMRGGGLGRALFDRLVQLAHSRNVGTLYLLTTTAEGFFAKVGFQRIDRRAVPAAVARTPEFEGLCPSTATCMVLALPTGR